MRFSKIDLIRQIRAVADLNLVDAKFAVELFLELFEITPFAGSYTYDFDKDVLWAFVKFMGLFAKKAIRLEGTLLYPTLVQPIGYDALRRLLTS
jgi:hypothetical protein